MSIRIKICGITNTQDALEAVEAGADALGFMFYSKSKRFVSPEQARQIIQQLPPFIASVGVFVNETRDRILEIQSRCRLDVIQLHGEESPEFCQELNAKTIKAFRIQSPESIEDLRRYRTDAWLVDSYSAAARGGTGEQFNWSWVAEAQPFSRPLIVAGGLSPTNAADCVRATQPFGLDVSSGVESAPGKKDSGKMKDFIQAAREAGFENGTEITSNGTTLATP